MTQAPKKLLAIKTLTKITATLYTLYQRCRPVQQWRLRIIGIYRWIYFKPLRCANWFRINRYLLPITKSRRMYVTTETQHFCYYAINKNASSTTLALLFDIAGYPPPTHTHIQGNLEIKHAFNTGKSIPFVGKDPTSCCKICLPVMDKDDSSHPYLPSSNGVFRFVFVRNPWARLVSCYQNRVVQLRPRIYKGFIINYPYIPFNQMSFADFVRFVCRVPDDLCDVHFRPQLAFFNPQKVDFIGRVEQFSNDLAYVIKHLGLDDKFLKWCYEAENKTSKEKHYTEFYNIKTRRLVAEKYKSDIARFNYCFGE